MNHLSNITRIVRQNSKVIYYHTILSVVLALICAGGLVLDDRTLAGVNVWLKPLKFSITTAIYLFTIGYFTHLYDFSRRKKSIINHVTAWTLTAELLIIIIQGARGVQSHYNISSPIDGLMYLAMGVFIGINVFIMALFLIDTLRGKAKVNPTMQVALIFGWAGILVGSYVGGQMIGQMSHTVGAMDGGVGMPLVNWSLNGGDLRIAHFFGVHSIQCIPLAAYFFTKKWNNKPNSALASTLTFAILYLGLMGLTFYQAKQGMPLISLLLQKV